MLEWLDVYLLTLKASDGVLSGLEIDYIESYLEGILIPGQVLSCLPSPAA